MPHKSPEAKSAYMKARYLQKKKELCQYQKDYREQNGPKITEKRRPYQRRYYLMTRMVRKVALLMRKGGKCERCGFDNLAALEFHHKDPSLKEFTINRAIAANSQTRYPWAKVVEEADKCEVLCGNCHAIEHNSWTEDELNEMLQLSEDYFSEELEKVEVG